MSIYFKYSTIIMKLQEDLELKCQKREFEISLVFGISDGGDEHDD